MSIINNGILLASEAAAAPVTGISRSLRFNSADSAYLSRTPASAGNRKTWTWAGWVKLGAISTVRQIFTARTSGSPYALFYIFSDDKISFADNALNTHTTAAIYRDPSAWYHLVLTIDTTSATSTNRVRLWVNGILQVWASTTAPTQNADGQINTATAHSIGSPQPYSGSEYFSGYLADVHFIDGQALDPTSFGEFDANGIWQPITFAGSYGTNGFKLTFGDNSTTAALGTDDSPNSNTWAVNNFSVAAGSGNDSLVDVPINGDQTDTGVGGEVRGNYCTANPLIIQGSGNSFANGNLDVTVTQNAAALTTIAFDISTATGFYAECTMNTVSANGPFVGIRRADITSQAQWYIGYGAHDYGYAVHNGNKYNNASSSSYGSTLTSGDILQIAVKDGKVWWGKNGTWFSSGDPAAGTNAAYTGITGNYLFGFSNSAASTVACSWNFGQRPFAYTAPSGFKALNTSSLPAPVITKPSEYMDVALYTGNGSTQTISGLGFSPDLVWIKSRSTAQDNNVFDAVRGVAGNYYALQTNATTAEGQYGTVSALTSDGFTLSNGGGATNFLNTTYVAWTWDAGSSTVTNNDGSITSSVRANPSAGFSIITFTGTGANGSIGHGLNAKPGLIIAKSRSAADNWFVYHSSIGANGYIMLNSTSAVDSPNATVWQGVEPTSSVFYSSTGGYNDNGVTLVAYAFSPVSGYSSFGSYTGNGSADGPFVYTGFRPRWVLIKSTGSSAWTLQDTSRSAYNLVDARIFPNTSEAELSNGNGGCDYLSNGFKIRVSHSEINTNAATYIYAAFAESPFQYARAR